MKLRFMARVHSGFHEFGLAIANKWTAVDVDALKVEGREALKTYAGVIVDIHPEDEAALAKLIESLPSTKAELAAKAKAAAGKKEPA